jgi:vesicle coat complex subunit
MNTRQYPNGPCESMFEHYAKHDPHELIRMIQNANLDDVLLSKAVEHAGDIDDPAFIDNAIAVLKKVARTHSTDYVREGAIYGLAKYISRQDVVETLADMCAYDECATVREIALETLKYTW